MVEEDGDDYIWDHFVGNRNTAEYIEIVVISVLGIEIQRRCDKLSYTYREIMVHVT